MTPERWKRIEELYFAALECAPEIRIAFLDEACGEDHLLRKHVESLLAESDRTSDFMARPAMEVSAESIAAQAARDNDARMPAQNLPSLGKRYVVLNETGRGGMGIVYRVRDNETDDIVAVKVLHPNIASDQQAVERFKAELKLARRVTHRNICRMYDIHCSENLTYLSMEFVDGESLRSVLKRLGALNARKGIELVREVCEGLREAHAQGIIHRDLKPENIMLDRNGRVKVMDFGIARLASNRNSLTMGSLGTPSYMSPEQAEGRLADGRSDIYALGLVMYEIFTGRIAFGGETPAAVALKQIRETPPSPRSVEPLLSAELEQLILRCIEKDPAKRFQSLDDVLACLPISGDPTPLPAHSSNTPKISGWFSETAYVMEPQRARILLLIIQAGYFCLYFAALFYLEPSTRVLVNELGVSGDAALRLLIFASVTGIATRLYLTAALAFNHPATGRQYWKLFPALVLLDALWAASPLMLTNKIGIGTAFACTAALAYLPFSQKTLMSNAYRQESGFAPESSR